MGSSDNVSLTDIYQELRYLHKKIDHLEHMMIPMEKMTAEEKKELDDAVKEYKTGKTVKFSDIKKD